MKCEGDTVAGAALFSRSGFQYGMSLKNYYTVLGVPQTAGADDIKSAFRALAKKYHPDKAPDNPFAAAHFTEIQEAYEVLSDNARRAFYDEERWLRGLSNRSRDAVSITPEWLLGEARRLQAHMKVIDTYRMNHAALRDYILNLLSDEHMSVLQGAEAAQALMMQAILESAVKLRHEYVPEVAQRLQLLTDVAVEEQRRVTEWLAQRNREAKWSVLRPIIMVLAALLLTLLLWLLK